MKRRTFLAYGIAGAATAIHSPALGRADTPPSPRRIRVGFLGITYSHGPDKLQQVQRSPDWEFVGVCDPSAAGLRACTVLGIRPISQEELLERAEVVAVESDIRDHARHALLALRAGKHVHVEKPVAATLAEVQALFGAARDRQRLLQSGYMWRHNPGFVALTHAVRQGWLGDVVQVRAYMGNRLAAERRPEWAEFAGGSMFEQGSHLIDATVRLLGAPKGVIPFLRHHGRFDDTLRDNNVAVLEYDHSLAILTNTALQAGSGPPRSFEVLGTRGTASLSPIEPPTLVLDLAEAAGPYVKGRQDVRMPVYRRYEGDLAELAAAVRGERPLGVSLDEEQRVAEVVLRVSGMS